LTTQGNNLHIKGHLSMVRKLVGLGRNVRDRVVSPVSLTVIFAVLAGICLWQGLRPDPVAVRGNMAPDGSRTTPSTPKYRTQEIRDITLGTWVLADNPEIDAAARAGEIEPSQWRRLVLHMEKEPGDRLDMELLRPLTWVESTGASAAETIALDIPEMHVQGPAYVQFVGPCPHLAPRPSPRHHLVTGTFVHSAANIIGLHVKGLAEPIRCTDNHPFWSEDRQEFVQAGSLQPDERLLTAHGESYSLERLIACEESVPVYNIEVQNQHTYFVSNLGLLAHNAGVKYLGRGKPRPLSELASHRAPFNRKTMWHYSSSPPSKFKQGLKRMSWVTDNPHLTQSQIKALGCSSGDTTKYLYPVYVEKMDDLVKVPDELLPANQWQNLEKLIVGDPFKL
jgi:hypothetical protein